jgi:signal transduction histidine kinase
MGQQRDDAAAGVDPATLERVRRACGGLADSDADAVAEDAVAAAREALSAAACALSRRGEVVASDGIAIAAAPDRQVSADPVTVAVDAPSTDHAHVARVGSERTLWAFTNDPGETGRVLTGLVADRIATAFARAEAEANGERALARIEEVASVVNHDLSNPLSIADGYFDVVRESCDSPYADHVSGAHDRLQTGIDDVVAMARGGAPVADTHPVPVARLAEEAWVNADRAVDRLAVPTDAAVRADPDRLLAVLERLFDNVDVHAGSDATVTVDVADGRLTVADDGPGLDADHRTRALEAGFSTAQDHSGLGLAVVARLAEAHGWTVALEESADGGLCVVLAGVERVE